MSSDEGKVRVAMIFDIIGKPKEHLVESLNKLLEELGNEKGVSMKSKDVKEPQQMKENSEFYTTFAEVEIEADGVFVVSQILFKYMPANIEIISPEIIGMSNSSWNEVINEVARRLHSYDELARMMQAERVFFMKKLKEKGISVKELVSKDGELTEESKAAFSEDLEEEKEEKK